MANSLRKMITEIERLVNRYGFELDAHSLETPKPANAMYWRDTLWITRLNPFYGVVTAATQGGITDIVEEKRLLLGLLKSLEWSGEKRVHIGHNDYELVARCPSCDALKFREYEKHLNKGHETTCALDKAIRKLEQEIKSEEHEHIVPQMD